MRRYSIAVMFVVVGCAHDKPPPLAAATKTEPQPLVAHEHGAGAGQPAKLFDNLGNHHRAISSKSPEAQRWFDQGLRLTFAFNHEEAQRSFERAAEIDPTCAACS